MTRPASAARLALLTALGSAMSVAAQDVQYEKYKLANGLTVILHEDHSLPVVAVNTWFRVGSKDEPARRSGFAHLFEHLMFMGTRRVPNGEFDALMEAGGGSNNASTSEDITNYFSTGPAALLPTLLWLDADRLEDLGRMTDQAKLDRQRDVVRNERRQSYENRPYGRAELLVQELLFPPGHPYHIPVIGTHEDLAAATVPDVRDFFATFYVPNNAALSVAGDFDPNQIKPLIAGLFGTLPRGMDPVRRTAEPVRLVGVKRSTLLDRVQLPMLTFAYSSPPRFSPGDAEMDLVAALLSEGKTSRLYKRLVYEDQLAVEVSAGQNSMQLGSNFQITILACPDADLDRIAAIVDEELARFCEQGPDAGELDRHKSTTELAMLRRLQGVLAVADLLNAYEYYWGEPNSFRRDLERYRQATVPSVQQWARSVLTPEARVLVRVLPEEAPRPPSAREQRPADLPSTAFTLPAPVKFALRNGMPVMLWREPKLPLVAVRLVITPAVPLETPEQAGLTELMTAMLREGAGERNALQFADALQALGAEFATSAEHETLDASLLVLKRNFAPAAELLADAVRRPRFDPPEWDRVRRVHLEELKQQDEEPALVARRVAARVFFGAAQPYGWPVAGTPDTVASLGLDDVTAAYRRLLRPESITILVAGDVSAEETRAVLDAVLGDWPRANEPTPAQPIEPPVVRGGPAVVIVDRQGAVQTVVCFVMPGPKYGVAERVRYRLLNTLLGGSFTSRLVQNLREAHGYTYGVHSDFVMEPSLGYFTATSSVRTDVTGAAVGEFLSEFKRIHAGDITADEAAKARASWQTGVIQACAGLNGLLRLAAEPVVAGLPFESVAQDLQRGPTITAEALNESARAAISMDQAVLVLVGDKAQIAEQLAALELPSASEVTVRGENVRTQRP